MSEKEVLKKLNLLGVNSPTQIKGSGLSYYWQKKYKEIKEKKLKKETIKEKLIEINEIYEELSKVDEKLLVNIINKHSKEENKEFIDAEEINQNSFNEYFIKKAENFYNLGMKKWHSRVVFKNEQILNDFNNACILDPENPLYFCHRGGLKIAIDFRGNYIEEAFDDLNKAILLNQNIAEFYFLRGFAYYFIGENSFGKKDFYRGRSIEPKLKTSEIVEKYLHIYKSSLHKDAIFRIYDDFSIPLHPF